MILNERVEDYFNRKEMEKENSQKNDYKGLNRTILNNGNEDNILTFSIKDDSLNRNIAELYGYADYTNSQFVVRQVNLNNELTGNDAISLVKRLLNSVIVNIESNFFELSVIYWRINKDNTSYLKGALDTGFEIIDSNTYSFETCYYLSGNPIRQNNNTRKVMKTYE